jgi:hypothetical protein
MIDINTIGKRPVGLFVLSASLMAERLIMQLFRGALVIAVLLGVIALINHEEPPAVAAPTPVSVLPKQDRIASTVLYPSSPMPVAKLVKTVPIVIPKEVVPPPDPVVPSDEPDTLVVFDSARVPGPVNPLNNRDVAPVSKPRQAQTEVDRVQAYCAKPGKTSRSWIRIKGRKHYC